METIEIVVCVAFALIGVAIIAWFCRPAPTLKASRSDNDLTQLNV